MMNILICVVTKKYKESGLLCQFIIGEECSFFIACEEGAKAMTAIFPFLPEIP
jgi:hypothetical protein